MNLFIASFIIMLLAVGGMALGLILTGNSIKGSCGGLNNTNGVAGDCGLCSKPCAKRRQALENS